MSFTSRTSWHQKFEKKSTDFEDNANKTSVFVSGWFYIRRRLFPSPYSCIHHLSIWLTCLASIVHLGWVGWVAMAIVAIVAGRVWNSKKWNLLCSCFSIAKRQNDKRRNDEICWKQLILRQDHHSGTVPVRERSFFRFELGFRRFVVSSFRRFVVSIARRVKSVNSFA